MTPANRGIAIMAELFPLAWDDPDRDRVLGYHLADLTEREQVDAIRSALMESLDVLQAVLEAAGTHPEFARKASAAISNRQFERAIGGWHDEPTC